MRKLLASVRSVKTIFAVVAAVVVLGAAAGGTLAWIYARTNPVQNTFTTKDVDITLTETDTGDGDGDVNTNRYPMMPGTDIDKDPVVTVSAQNMPCWLFVKVNESANLDDFIAYTVAEDWAALEGVENVYVRQVQQMDVAQAFPILKDNKVHVKPEVTYEMLRALTAETYPTLTFEAIAVQLEGVANVQDAWKIANGEIVPTPTPEPTVTPDAEPGTEPVTP